jgi:DNA-binding CsgD family transcriptional regulator
LPIPAKRRNPEREEQIFKLRGEGKTSAQIAEMLGVTNGTVGYYLNKKRGGKAATSSSKESEILKMRAEGRKPREIAESLGLKIGAVNYYFYKTKSAKTNKKEGVNGEQHSNGSKEGFDHSAEAHLEVQQAYAAGRIEEILRGHAAGCGVPFAPFALGVAESLRATARRELLRMPNSMQALRGKAAQGA